MGVKDDWQKDYTKVAALLHNEKDKDILDEIKKRKAKYNATASFTVRRWVRLGYEADKNSDG